MNQNEPLTRGLVPGVMMLMTSNAEARREAQRRCQHRYRLWSGRDDDHPFGNIEAMALWCAENIGPRHVDWYYRGGGVWCFAELEAMMMFRMVWE